MQLKTVNGYLLSEAISAMQKEIRRGNAKLAGFWALEVWSGEKGYDQYVWRRLLVISAEDVAGYVTQEIAALHAAYNLINEHTRRGERRGRIFISKAVLLLSAADKSRDPDHLQNLVYDQGLGRTDAEIEASLDDVRREPIEVPDFAYDCHTSRGKKAGRTKAQFFAEEHAALKPRAPGLFDNLVATADAMRPLPKREMMERQVFNPSSARR